MGSWTGSHRGAQAVQLVTGSRGVPLPTCSGVCTRAGPLGPCSPRLPPEPLGHGARGLPSGAQPEQRPGTAARPALHAGYAYSPSGAGAVLSSGRPRGTSGPLAGGPQEAQKRGCTDAPR